MPPDLDAEFDEEAGFDTVTYQLQYLITADYKLTTDREAAAFAICGDEETGMIEVDIATQWYGPITYH